MIQPKDQKHNGRIHALRILIADYISICLKSANANALTYKLHPHIGKFAEWPRCRRGRVRAIVYFAGHEYFSATVQKCRSQKERPPKSDLFLNPIMINFDHIFASVKHPQIRSAVRDAFIRFFQYVNLFRDRK